MKLYQKPRFLTEEQMSRVHESSLRILRDKGVVFRAEKARQILTSCGARAEGEIVYFPEKLLTLPRSFAIAKRER